MANTSSRTLRLLSLLQNHRYWPGADLAARLDVSLRTLRRDVERLRELGYPVTAHPGVDGGYQLAAGAALPPLAVDDEEAVALAVALQAAAAQGGVSGIAESSVRVLAKIVTVMPARLRQRVEALAAMTVPATWGSGGGGGGGGGPSAPVNASILTAIALACRDAERIRFLYMSAEAVRTERHVEPNRLVPLRGRWYLVAYDLTRQDWRTFRLDRMAEPPRGTGERFRPRELPTADAAEFVQASISGAASGYDVEVLVSAPAAQVQAKIGRWCRVEPVGAARCRVLMTTDSLDWPVFALGVIGVEFSVVSPPELVELIRDWGGRFGRATATMGA
jgi:predicted DNA-binding transcriptional regulator YafY